MKKPLNPPKELDGDDFKADQKMIMQYIKATKDQDYPHWDQIRYRITKPEYHAQVWSFIKLLRLHHGYTERTFGKTKVKWNSLPSLQEILFGFDREYGRVVTKIGDYSKLALQANSVREEAISSSILEGAVTTRKLAREMIEKGRKPKTLGEKMVMNNYVTMNFITENDQQEMTEPLLLKIHESMTIGTLEDIKSEGAFRNSDDIDVVDAVTGEVFWHPPPHEEARKMVDDLITFINRDKPFIHPILKASIIHFMIGYTHPFDDGNGRTARAVFYWYLLNQGYDLMEYLSISTAILNSKVQYNKAYLYCENDENDITYFMLYQVKVLKRSFEGLVKYLKEFQKAERRIFEARIKYEDLNERQKIIMLSLEEDPQRFWTVKGLMKLFNVVQETARRDLLGLEQKGMLKSITEGKRKSYYRES